MSISFLFVFLIIFFVYSWAFEEYDKFSPSLRLELLKFDGLDKVTLSSESLELILLFEGGFKNFELLESLGKIKKKIKFSDHVFVIAQIPIGNVYKLKEIESLKYVKLPKIYKPLLDKASLYAHVESIRKDYNLMDYDGKGVIIGIVDTGIDYKHPAFEGRILEIYDLTTGEVCKKEDILNGTCTQRDENGHGTHVAGIAAGNHETYKGIAPGAELIIVKAGNLYFEEDKLIEGIEILAKRIKDYGKPGVINLSLGSFIGPHDGTDLFSKFLSSVINQYKVPIVVAAGNKGHAPIHAKLNLYKATKVDFRIHASFAVIDIWIMGNDDVNISVSSPCGETGVIKQGETKIFDLKECGNIEISYSGINPFNGDKEVYIKIKDINISAVQNQIWSINFIPNNIQDGEVHLWGEGKIEFMDPDFQYTISNESATDGIIAVGSFVSKTNIYINPNSIQGKISNFSSRGPTRRCSKGCVERIKPDIVAPGEIVCSAYPISNAGSLIGFYNVCTDSNFRASQGTSIAAPIVTGIIALLLQANPNLTPEEIKQFIISNSLKDNFTGNKPNNTYGYGKIDAYKTLISVLKTNGISVGIPDSTPSEIIQVSTGGGGCNSFQAQASGILLSLVLIGLLRFFKKSKN